MMMMIIKGFKMESRRALRKSQRLSPTRTVSDCASSARSRPIPSRRSSGRAITSRSPTRVAIWSIATSCPITCLLLAWRSTMSLWMMPASTRFRPRTIWASRTLRLLSTSIVSHSKRSNDQYDLIFLEISLNHFRIISFNHFNIL